MAKARVNVLVAGKQSSNVPAEGKHNPAMAPADWSSVCTDWNTDQESFRSRQRRESGTEALERLHVVVSCDSDTGSEDKGSAVVVGCQKDFHAPMEDQMQRGWGSRMDAHLRDVRRNCQVVFQKLQAAVGNHNLEKHGQSLEIDGHQRFHRLEKKGLGRVASGGAD